MTAKTATSIGIDFGTSTSEIACFVNGAAQVIPDPIEKTFVMPSVVAIDKTGKRLLAGHEALPVLEIPGHGVREIKRELGTDTIIELAGGHNFRPPELVAAILKRLRRNAEAFLSKEIKNVVLTVPAIFPDAARAATRDAGEIAGLNIVRLISEPTAAAMAYGILDLEKEERVLVFDFGGGTLDITVLELVSGIIDVSASFGDPKLGGKDIDELLKAHFLESFMRKHAKAKVGERSLQRLKTVAEKAKKALSRETSFSTSVEFFGSIGSDLHDLDIDITATEFRRLLTPILDRARSCINTGMKNNKIKPESIQKVLLVGGTTYIPAIREIVAGLFNKEPSTDVEPDLAVAKGACIQAALLSGDINEEEGPLLSDVSAFGLGVPIVTEVGGQTMLVYDPLILPNEKIPYSVTRDYFLLHEEQKNVEFELLQDPTGKAVLPEHAIPTNIKGEITGIPPSTTGQPHPVVVKFSYDVNRLVTLDAEIPAINKTCSINYEASKTRLSNTEKAAAARRIVEFEEYATQFGVFEDAPTIGGDVTKWNAHPSVAEYAPFIKKADDICEQAGFDSDLKRRLEAASTELKTALAEDKNDELESLLDRLLDILANAEH